MMKKERATASMKNNILYVKPESATYEMVYRSATGVYWDEEEKALFYKAAPTDSTEQIEIIIKAVKKEYSVDLAID